MARDRRQTDRRTDAVSAPDERRGTDRRMLDRRMDARVEVAIWAEQERALEHCLRRTADLSAGGLKLDHGLPHPAGTIVRVRFTLPGDETSIEVHAQVLAAEWEDGRPITHVRFMNLRGEDHIRITRFVESCEGEG